ncbi:unnamed protein product, partial [Brassica rapa subsp. trilocularis]
GEGEVFSGILKRGVYKKTKIGCRITRIKTAIRWFLALFVDSTDTWPS